MILAAGEELILRGDHSCHWAAQRTLFVADLHLGKAEHFRQAGIPTPGSPARQTLAKLTRAIQETDANRLVILGDFWHARTGRTIEVLQEIADWRSEQPTLEIHLILGNHDRMRQGEIIPADWGFHIHAHQTLFGPFAVAHYPEPHESAYVLSGHLHPAIKIYGRGRQSVSVPCFWFGHAVAVLPAFGGYTGTAHIQPRTGDTVFAVADGEIVKLPPYTS
jgi:uncharacterized protein